MAYSDFTLKKIKDIFEITIMISPPLPQSQSHLELIHIAHIPFDLFPVLMRWCRCLLFSTLKFYPLIQ